MKSGIDKKEIRMNDQKLMLDNLEDCFKALEALFEDALEEDDTYRKIDELNFVRLVQSKIEELKASKEAPEAPEKAQTVPVSKIYKKYCENFYNNKCAMCKDKECAKCEEEPVVEKTFRSWVQTGETSKRINNEDNDRMKIHHLSTIQAVNEICEEYGVPPLEETPTKEKNKRKAERKSQFREEYELRSEEQTFIQDYDCGIMELERAFPKVSLDDAKRLLNNFETLVQIPKVIECDAEIFEYLKFLHDVIVKANKNVDISQYGESFKVIESVKLLSDDEEALDRFELQSLISQKFPYKEWLNYSSQMSQRLEHFPDVLKLAYPAVHNATKLYLSLPKEGKIIFDIFKWGGCRLREGG